MRKFIGLVLLVGGFAVGGLIFVRYMEGLDLVTGEDPRYNAARFANAHLQIEMVSNLRTLFEVVDQGAGLKGYFQIIDGERLTGAVQIARCNQPRAGESVPRFATGTNWVCIMVATDAGDRQHVSFSLRHDALDEAWAFYETALEKLPVTTGGSQRQTGSRWNSLMFAHNADSGRQVHIRFFSTPPGVGPLITIADTAAR